MAAQPKGNVLGRFSLPAKIVFGLVLCSVVAGLYLIVFYASIDGEISAAVSQEQVLRGDLQKAEEAKVAYQRDVEDKTRRQQLERDQKKILPDEAETPSFLAGIQNVATTSGVVLSQYRPEDEVGEEYYVRVPMNLTLRGRFHQIARFFFGIGQLERVTNIEDLQIQIVRNTVDPNEILLDVSCLATAFRAKRAGETLKGKAR